MFGKIYTFRIRIENGVSPGEGVIENKKIRYCIYGERNNEVESVG